MSQSGVAGQRNTVVFRDVVGDDNCALHPLGGKLLSERRNRQPAAGFLPAGHRDRAVIQNLIRDVDPGRPARFDRQGTGMKVSAVADVLKNMFPLDEWRHADPRRALPTHVRQECVATAGLPLRGRHAMTANAARGHLAFQNHRRPVVRAA